MRLCIMKRECLDEIKSNLDRFYPLYFDEENNSWMAKVCGQNPFQFFGKEIPDFKLAELDNNRSIAEIDLENCKIIYSNLRFLSESQASDERLWAGLTNGIFYEYMRKRCRYDVLKPKEKNKQASQIKSRYFFKGGVRSGFYRNFLAKCWWVGRALYDEKDPDHFKKLDILGARDLSTKISDIFYSMSYSSNPEILDGVIMFYEHMNEEGFHYDQKGQARKALQHLNAVGGAIVLDCLSKEEIKDELVDYLDHLVIGDDSEMFHEGLEGDDEIEEAEIVIGQGNDDDNNQDTDCAMIGDKVITKKLSNGEEKKFKIELQDNGDFLPIPKMLIGKIIGDTIECNNIQYKILKIEHK